MHWTHQFNNKLLIFMREFYYMKYNLLANIYNVYSLIIIRHFIGIIQYKHYKFVLGKHSLQLAHYEDELLDRY